MIYHTSVSAVVFFLFFVGAVLGLSTFLGKKAKTARGYFAAHGQIHWFVNGIAFAGDYLSAASFLGICGLIAFYGYDGFLYSIGYLAGWVVALLVIAEPIKRLGKFTFADALDSKFNSPGIKLSAALSTLVVSIFYLIPQMVGAGTLVQPLLGFSYNSGVIIVGAVVIVIVVTAGMVSTTWVQFIKGSLLVFFCTILTAMVLHRGLVVTPNAASLHPQTLTVTADGTRLVNGLKQHGVSAEGGDSNDLMPGGEVSKLPGGVTETGPLGPLEFIKTLAHSSVVTWTSKVTTNKDKSVSTVYTPKSVSGADMLLPGGSPTFKGVKSTKLVDKLDFISLMLALFCGTASLPHILIRYYTVKDASSARKSTVVGIVSIGFFYVLTLFIGLGAMTSSALDLTNNNMSAPLLARSFNETLFAVISAIAFTTVLGTVSGLILAASGAVAHDLMTNFLKLDMSEKKQVFSAKVAAVVIGVIAMWLAIQFQKLNVSFLVGWAFNIAASANLPSLVMLLFWKRTTRHGITAAILVGLFSSLTWLLLSAPAYKDVYGLDPAKFIAPAPFSQPGLVTIPIGFVVLIVVSLLTQSSNKSQAAPST